MPTTPSHAEHALLTSEMQKCIQACQNCHNLCLMTAEYCLQMGSPHAEAAHLRLMWDCAEICQTSANFMVRGSGYHARICAICVVICEQCAQDCERLGDDETMQACAQACRICAESCRQMAAMPM